MSATHTKGIIRVKFDGHIINYVGEPYCSLVVDNVSSQLVPVPIAKEVRMSNARRLAACWNACEGLTMDHFDGGWTAKGLSSHAKSLEGKLAEERKRSAAAITLLLEAASKLEIVITGIGDNYDATNLAPRIRAFLKGQP